MARILIFGDSITYGAWDRKGGWVLRLKRFLHQRNLSDSNKQSDFVYNLGVSGNTTKDLLNRFESETKRRLKKGAETIIVFDIGINDCQFIHSKNGLRLSSEDFRNNLQKLFNLAERLSSKIIFVGLTPVDEEKTTPIPWNEDKSWKNKYINQFNKTLRSFCEEKKVYFVDLLEDFMETNYKILLEDGSHPNVKGHQKIFEIVKNFLIKNKIV